MKYWSPVTMEICSVKQKIRSCVNQITSHPNGLTFSSGIARIFSIGIRQFLFLLTASGSSSLKRLNKLKYKNLHVQTNQFVTSIIFRNTI